MKNHLIHFLALTLAMALALCGCGSKSAPERTMPDTSEDASLSADISAIEEETEDTPDFLQQYDCISANASLWLDDSEEAFEPCCYTVTDLDGNGLLEVIRSTCQGSGMYSTSAFFEVNEAMDGMTQLEYGVEEGDSEPDIITSYVTIYYDDEHCYYLFNDTIRNGAAENFTVRYALLKEGSAIRLEKLGASHLLYNLETDEEEETFYDAEGGEIDMTTYYNIDETRFSQFSYDVRSLDWQALDAESDFAMFAQESYEAFASGAALERSPYQLDIYANDRSELYQSLGDDVVQLPGVENPETAVRFVCGPDGVQVALEQVEWIESASVFRPLGDVFREYVAAGTVYEFPATLAETVPSYRLSVQDAYGTDCWYLTMDGSGEREDPIELRYAEHELLLPTEDEPIAAMCQAYAGMLFTAGSMDALETDYFWQTVGSAAMMQTLKAADADENGCIFLSDWLMDAYCDSIFPYHLQPELTEDCPVSTRDIADEPYVVRDALAGCPSTHIVGIDFDDDEVMKVMVAISTPDGEEGVDVYVQPNPYIPFGYQITGGTISVG